MEGGRGERESPRDTERVQVCTLVTYAQLILHSKFYIDNSGAILTTKYTHTCTCTHSCYSSLTVTYSFQPASSYLILELAVIRAGS